MTRPLTPLEQKRYLVTTAIRVVVFIGVLAVGLSFVYAAWGRYQDRQALLASTLERKDVLTAKVAAQEDIEAQLQTRPYVESLIREELGYVYPGEVPYVVVAPQGPQAAVDAQGHPILANQGMHGGQPGVEGMHGAGGPGGPGAGGPGGAPGAGGAGGAVSGAQGAGQPQPRGDAGAQAAQDADHLQPLQPVEVDRFAPRYKQRSWWDKLTEWFE